MILIFQKFFKYLQIVTLIFIVVFTAFIIHKAALEKIRINAYQELTKEQNKYLEQEYLISSNILSAKTDVMNMNVHNVKYRMIDINKIISKISFSDKELELCRREFEELVNTIIDISLIDKYNQQLIIEQLNLCFEINSRIFNKISHERVR